MFQIQLKRGQMVSECPVIGVCLKEATLGCWFHYLKGSMFIFCHLWWSAKVEVIGIFFSMMDGLFNPRLWRFEPEEGRWCTLFAGYSYSICVIVVEGNKWIHSCSWTWPDKSGLKALYCCTCCILLVRRLILIKLYVLRRLNNSCLLGRDQMLFFALMQSSGFY